ncbi:MAG: NAD-dependent epimerase/dehydratase family protein [Candidatus Riflebacteria bacterium]|nr:NAD-dependent epimerase/dehydratase family protein [Candidatus Riflebacteria bacterium]
MKILITGASGFIGSHVVRSFSKNHDVTALVRPNSDIRFIAKYRAKILRTELESKSDLENIVSEFDLVVHVAAKASDWGDYKDFYQANVVCTLNLVDVLPQKTGIILISSNAVLGEEDSIERKSEDSIYAPELHYFGESVFPSAMNHYRLSKTIAEQMAIARAEKRGLKLTVIRPVWVYGPREFHAGPYEYCKTVMSGIPCMPGTDKNRFHAIYVEDLAGIVKEVALNQPSGVSIYNAGNPDIPFMNDYWETFCRHLGRTKPFNLPKWLLYPLGIILEFLWMLFKAATPPLFTRARIYMFYANNMYNVDKIKRDFPDIRYTSLENGVKKTVRWWRMNKYL